MKNLVVLLVIIACSLTVFGADSRSGPSEDYTFSLGDGGATADFETALWAMKLSGCESTQNPQFQFWSLEDTNRKYIVKLMSIYESIPTVPGEYDPEVDVAVASSTFSLSSSAVSWEITSAAEDDFGGMNFTILGTKDETVAESQQAPFDEMLLTFYIDSLIDEGQMKFDLELVGYQWTDSSEESMLVIHWLFTGSGDSESLQVSNNEATLGYSQVSCADEATGCSGSESCRNSDGSVVQAKLSCDSDSSLYLAYSHFEESLLHDPTLAIDGAASLGVSFLILLLFSAIAAM